MSLQEITPSVNYTDGIIPLAETEASSQARPSANSFEGRRWKSPGSWRAKLRQRRTCKS